MTTALTMMPFVLSDGLTGVPVFMSARRRPVVRGLLVNLAFRVIEQDQSATAPSDRYNDPIAQCPVPASAPQLREWQEEQDESP
jgi:hypothetical protein